MRILPLLLGASLWAATTQSALAEKRVALVIGNSGYQNVAKLPNPVNDAAAIAALFKAAGFDAVDTRRDVGSLDFKRAIREFALTSRDADIAVVYFAGHGIEVRGINYLIPVDAKLANDLDTEDEAISLDRIASILEPVKRLRLIILDACRDNPFLKTMQRTIATRAVSQGLAKVEPMASNFLIAYAARAGSTAEDGNGTHSPFTTALLQHLTVPGVEINKAFRQVRDDVLRSTGKRQEPFVYGSLGGDDISLVPGTKKDETPLAAATADPASAIRLDYELAERVGTKEAWDSFLKKYESGFYADLAFAQLTKIVAAERARGDGAQPDQQKSTIIAALPAPPDQATERSLAPGDISRQLRIELKRVGCGTGAADDGWDASARQALERFNKHANLRLETRVASLDALDAVKSKPSRVCPLVCERGYRADGESCVSVICKKGYAVDDDGNCEKEKTRSIRSEQNSDSKPSKSGGGQISCGQFGCNTVPPGCHEEQYYGHNAVTARIVCR